MNTRPAVLAAILLIVAAPVLAPVVEGQTAGPTPTGEGPVGGSDGNGTGTGGSSGPPTPAPVPNSTAANNTTGNGGWLGIPNPIDALGNTVGWAIGGVIHESMTAINMGVEYIVILFSGVPAPGEADDPSTWYNPDNGLWGSVYETWKYIIGLSIMITMAGIMLTLSRESGRQRQKELIQHGKSLTFQVFTFPLAAMGLHIANAISLGIAPGRQEFLASTGGIARLIGGGLFGIIVAYVATGVILAGMGMLLIQYVLVHATVFLLPLGWALNPYGGTFRSWGVVPLYLYGLLIGTKIVQSAILRWLFSISWTSAEGALLGPLVTFAGLAFALYWFPKQMIQQASQAASVGLGMSAFEQADRDTLSHARERVGHEVDRVRNLRDDADTDTDTSPTRSGGIPEAGSPGVSSANIGRSNRAGQFGNSNGESGGTTSSPDADIDPNRGYQ